MSSPAPFETRHVPAVRNCTLIPLAMLPAALLALLILAPLSSLTAQASSSDSSSSLLEQYVDTPDPNYAWELTRTIQGEGYTAAVLRMTSQRWLSEAEVDNPIWWHWLTVVVPEEIKSDTAFFYISGGDNEDAAPEKVEGLMLPLALESGAVTAILNMVPNQPLAFASDGEPRTEDSLIAYGWNQFLHGGAQDKDAIWLARLPMTKAAVRGMDTVTAFMAGKDGGGRKIDKFVVGGGSKRGWTTWTTGLVDERVVAIVPIVIDLLNVRPSFEHHWQAYGFWSAAVGDYNSQGIMDWQHTDEYKRLLELVDPFEHRSRLTLPKLLINATGDEFFLPDSWQFYWRQLEGEKALRYVPNSNHSMAGTDVLDTVTSYFMHIIHDVDRPQFDWSVDDKAFELQLDKGRLPKSVTLWQASNPKKRDFRVVSIKRSYEAKDVTRPGKDSYRVKIKAPKEGFTASFLELEFEGPEGTTLKLSTGIKVLPDVLPNPPFEPNRGAAVTPY